MRDLSGSNSELAADHNRGVVLRTIHRGGPISRTELAARTRLTKQAIARIVERLIGEGLVVEARRRRQGRGQPAIELEIDPAGAAAIGISLARDHVTIVAVDGAGVVRGRVHVEQRFIPPQAFFDLVGSVLADFRRRRILSSARMAGIGVAVPDWLGEIPFPGMTEEFRAWAQTDMRARLAQITSEAVYIENDATAAAMGELNYGLGLESRSFVYAFIGAGLGGGVVLDGVCHHGTGGLSGEIGWLPILVSDPRRAEPLGQRLSLFALYERLAAAGYRVDEPQALLQLDEAGRALVSAWLLEVAVPLSKAVVDIGLLVDPDAVLIGGRLPARLIDELLLHVHDHLRARGWSAPSLHRAAGSEDAAARGAAAMPLADLLRLDRGDAGLRRRSPMRRTVPGDG